MDNQQIADTFILLAKLMYIHGENSFKAKSYSTASFTIEKLPGQLSTLPHEEIFRIKGIGDAIGNKIIEILQTGQLKALENIVNQTPPGIIEMLGIKGIGPKKIAVIWKELGVETLGELLYACNENRLTMYKGFGAKTQQNIQESIEFYLRCQGRFLYAQVETYTQHLQQAFNTQFPHQSFMITGSFRRQLEIIDELEWCTTTPLRNLQDFMVAQSFEIISTDETLLKVKGTENIPLLFHHCTPDNTGTVLFLTSSSQEFITQWTQQAGTIPEVADEAAVFTKAGIPYIISPQREEGHIIQQARNNKLLPVLQPGNIKGIIHSHSDWSDGADTLATMAKGARQQGFEYLVISDHSKSAFYANGLTEERVHAQHQQIAELNEQLAPFKIFRSIESDILYDGRLDYSDEVLATFDLVIASVHSNLKMNQDKAMQRLLAAVSNPFTTILGHPTGRLLLSRNGYPVDHELLIEACKAHNVVLELNAHPRRLDIDWRWINKAIDAGILISINPDAHAVDGFHDIKYGVLVAQKAGVTGTQNLSSMSRAEFEAFLVIQQQKRK